jgi:2-polyprenyl-3-methyl-5-hydroxy-6-metoxy-1,4-benzoquinol methylase
MVIDKKDIKSLNKKITNPIYYELLKLNLIKKKSLFIIANTCRDRNIRVFQDLESKIIFLQKNVKDNNYYSSLKAPFFPSKTMVRGKIISTAYIDDASRRLNLIKLKKKKILKLLDFGSGWGDFFLNFKKKDNIKKIKLFSCEIRSDCLNHIKKEYPFVELVRLDKDPEIKFDIITAFHVLEHLSEQLNTIKYLKKFLKKNGKLIIEVPHARDLLIENQMLPNFKKFIFWSQHLILHTEYSLTKFLKSAGFKKVKISYVQRYNFDNHNNWLINGKPGGHILKTKLNSEINQNYINFLKKIKKTDTLIAEAT